MPELPEVETTKNGISPYLEGFTIERIIVRQAKLRWQVSHQLTEIFQQKVLALSRRAKYLIIHLEKGYIIGHLGMSGSLRVVANSDPINKHDHLDIVINNGKIIRYNDPRRFGAWLWTDELEKFALFQKLGPEPLSEQFSSDYLFKKSRHKSVVLKSFIMNNAIVVGVGNIYANEVLFKSGLHPQKAASSLSKKQVEILTHNIKQELNRAIQQGGTTLKDFVQPDGKPGYFAQQLQVYGRKDQPCPKCGTKIENLIIAQRNSFFCRHCQSK